MTLLRLAVLALGGSALILNPLRAQTPPPWTPDKQFSADVSFTTKEGMTTQSRLYIDTGKIRADLDGHGMKVELIILPAEKKIYNVMEQQQMVMEMPLSDAIAQRAAAATGGGGVPKIEVIGPDTVDGTLCTKYKMTTSNPTKVFFFWISTAANSPVKVAAEDGSFAATCKNYKPGAQDPVLFQPPASYKVIQMPAGMNMPGGGAGGQ